MLFPFANARAFATARASTEVHNRYGIACARTSGRAGGLCGGGGSDTRNLIAVRILRGVLPLYNRPRGSSRRDASACVCARARDREWRNAQTSAKFLKKLGNLFPFPPIAVLFTRF